MSLLDNLPHTFDHGRPSYVESDNKLGGDRRVFRIVSEDVACWVQNASAREIEAFAKQDEIITHKVFVASAQPLRPGDMLHVTSGPFKGKLLNHKAFTERGAGTGAVYASFSEQENNLSPAEWMPVESSSSSSESSASKSASSASTASTSSSLSSKSSSSSSQSSSSVSTSSLSSRTNP